MMPWNSAKHFVGMGKCPMVLEAAVVYHQADVV